MSNYFKHIVERTLGLGSRTIIPAIAPDSIPEGFIQGAENPHFNKLLLTRSLADMTNQRTISEKETFPDAHLPNLAEGKQTLHTGRSEMGKSDGTIEKDVEPDREQVKSAANVDIKVHELQKSVQSDAGDKASADKATLLASSLFFTDKPLFRVDRERANEKSSYSSREVVQNNEQDVSAQNNSSGGFSEKPLLQPQQPLGLYAALIPAIHDTSKFHVPPYYEHRQQQPQETIVTIHIGRIEVNAKSAQSDPVPISRRRFSPALSLADYLRQRSEERRGK